MGLCNSLKCDIVIAILQSFSAITSIWNISVVTLSFPCMLQFFPPLLRSLPLTSYLYLLHLLQALNLLSSPVSDCRYKFISSFLAQRYLFNPFFVLYFLLEHTLESVFSYPNNPLGISCKHNIFSLF